MRGILLKAPPPHLSPPAGRGRIALAIRVRGSLRKRGRDCFKNARHVVQHFIVPKSQYAVVVVDKPFVTNRIARVIRVLPSVDLNNEATITANKIDDIGTDRILPDELVSIQPARPQPMPERRFGIRSGLPQTPGASCFHFVRRPHAATLPHPDCTGRCLRIAGAIRPLPARGERLAFHEPA
jgi:hypothetical protein